MVCVENLSRCHFVRTSYLDNVYLAMVRSSLDWGLNFYTRFTQWSRKASSMLIFLRHVGLEPNEHLARVRCLSQLFFFFFFFLKDNIFRQVLSNLFIKITEILQMLGYIIM
jgi:hypothetical protein